MEKPSYVLLFPGLIYRYLDIANRSKYVPIQLRICCITFGGPLVYRRRHVQIYSHFPSVLMLFLLYIFLRYHSTPQPQTMTKILITPHSEVAIRHL